MDLAILVLILAVIGLCVFVYLANKTTDEAALRSSMGEAPVPYKVEPPVKLRSSTIEALGIAHGAKDSTVKKPTRAKRAKQIKRSKSL